MLFSHYIMEFAFLILVSSMLLLLLKIVTFEDKYNKLLAANAFSSNVIVFIVFLAAITDDNLIIDVALVYAFINFVAMIGLSKFFLLKR